jgi:MFS family permease
MERKIQKIREIGLIDKKSSQLSFSPPLPFSRTAVFRFINLTRRTLSGVMFAPALRSVLADFGSESETLAALCISIYVAGYAIGPLIWAPLSELYGRRVINNWTNILFLLTEVGSGAAPTLSFLIVARFFGGFFSSSRFVLGGAIINDVIDPMNQGRVMAVLNFGGTICSVFGPGVYIPSNLCLAVLY